MLDAITTHCTAGVVCLTLYIGSGGCIGITVTTRPIIRTRAGAEPSTWKTPLECWRETELHQMIMSTKVKKSHGDASEYLIEEVVKCFS